MVFHWSLSDSKSPQVSRTLLSILAVFHNVVVCMVSPRLPTSKSSRPFIIIYSLEFFTSALADGLSWSLSDNKSPQVSRTLLSILSVLYNVVVWIVSTRPPTSKSTSSFSNPLVSLPKAPITISIIVTCMFHSFFHSLSKSRYYAFFSHSFISRDCKVDNFANSHFFFC